MPRKRSRGDWMDESIIFGTLWRPLRHPPISRQSFFQSKPKVFQQRSCQGGSKCGVTHVQLPSDNLRIFTIVGIRQYLQPFGPVDFFEVLPAGRSDTKMKAFALFSTAEPQKLPSMHCTANHWTFSEASHSSLESSILLHNTMT